MTLKEAIVQELGSARRPLAADIFHEAVLKGIGGWR